MTGGRGVRAPVKRSRKRSFRKKKLRRIIVVAVLAALLIALGVYYMTGYRQHMLYRQYPLRYEEQITGYAEQFQLEPWHVAAVIRCESSFNPQATSSVGARGLMQIMPETGEWIAHKLDEDATYTDDSLYEPEVSIRYGCWYLNWLMKRYSGERMVATAAYHAGHGTVDKWLSDPEISPDGATLARIPYDSTSTYVRRVLNACEKYQALYPFDDEAA